MVAITVWIPFGQSWRTAMAWLAAGAAAGATWASLAALFQVENPATHVLILPASGAVGALAFWLVTGQQQSVGYIVLGGALLVPTLFFFEGLLSGKRK
jgi:hypothetical protein